MRKLDVDVLLSEALPIDIRSPSIRFRLKDRHIFCHIHLQSLNTQIELGGVEHSPVSDPPRATWHSPNNMSTYQPLTSVRPSFHPRSSRWARAHGESDSVRLVHFARCWNMIRGHEMQSLSPHSYMQCTAQCLDWWPPKLFYCLDHQ